MTLIKKKFYIESLGCAKNQVDSEIIIALLERSGFACAETPEQAEIIIVNTCGFIEPARQESIDTVLELKSAHPFKKVIMVGCLSERYGEVLFRELTEIDGFWGIRYSVEFLRFMEKISDSDVPVPFETTFENSRQVRRKRLLSFPGSAYVKIADGCDNRCTYCAIPRIRGPLSSRSRDALVRECGELLERGIKEINIVAQDIASYGRDRGKSELCALVREIMHIKSDFWLRLLYLHPDNFPPDLLSIAESEPRLVPYFDLPFQHASEKILKRMGRKGNADRYEELVRAIREKIPDAVIRTTFLTGFPGENDGDVRMVCDFMKKVRFQWAGVFSYSREEGTEAWAYVPPVNKTEARKRKRRLEAVQSGITGEWLDSLKGKILEVLIEENIEGSALALARSRFHAPEVDGLIVVNGENLRPGTLQKVRIVKRNGVDLEAVKVLR